MGNLGPKLIHRLHTHSTTSCGHCLFSFDDLVCILFCESFPCAYPSHLNNLQVKAPPALCKAIFGELGGVDSNAQLNGLPFSCVTVCSPAGRHSTDSHFQTAHYFCTFLRWLHWVCFWQDRADRFVVPHLLEERLPHGDG